MLHFIISVPGWTNPCPGKPGAAQHLPAVLPDSDDFALLQALWGMRQKLFLFAFTFIIVGMSWLGHHQKFTYIARVTDGSCR